MAQQRSIEIRVGIFVLASLVVIGGLIIKFGKLERFSAKTYDIVVVFPNVGGIVKDANVMYAGIPIGKVRGIRLVENERLEVRLTLAIDTVYRIHQDAKFVVNQSGLLGDRYIDIIPQSTTAPVVKPGDQLEGETSVDLTEAIRGVVDVLHQAAGTIARVDDAAKRIDEMILSTQNILHVSETLANVETTTSNTVVLTASVGSLVESNRGKVDAALTDLSKASKDFSAASHQVEELVQRVNMLVVTNTPEVQAALTNLTASAERLNNIFARFEKGEGTAGKLLVDPKLHDDLVELIEKINRYGLFYNTSIGPKPDRRAQPERSRNPPAEQARPPTTNFRP